MTIYVIRFKEYECDKCGYRWINRINGKDGPIPERCVKCKRSNWNGELEIETEITPEENPTEANKRS
jgi:predicted Zn-ribbon and HTH transcriptional regulator